jgi:hypothetical protein
MAPPVLAPGAAPLEAPAIAAWAASLAAWNEVSLPSFEIARIRNRHVAGFDESKLGPAVNVPLTVNPGGAEVQPIPTIALAPPLPAPGRIAAAMPEPGMFQLEYHSHRLRSSPVCQPEWHEVRFAPAPPRFAVRPVFEKLEDLLLSQKQRNKKPDFVETSYTMPVGKTPPTVVLLAFKIAAGILLASTLWFGFGMYRGERRLTAREGSGTGSVLSAPNRVLTSDGAAQARSTPTGMVAWAKHTVAQRAALQYTEGFKGGMENWGAAAQSYPARWSRNADGYVESGALALFHPTLKFTDYRLDFFAQIENKSVAWTVRAKDEKNYHAMKVSVVEAGLRPFVALVQYDVVDGKAGRRSETPLNIMVHNNQPMQVAVDVVGSRFVTSIDGEEVDRYTGGLLASGGVGFFSDIGEHARLYWMRVSRNDDWLGHVCAFVAGGQESVATAELEVPGLPGAPGSGDTPVGTLAALGMGLPGNALKQRARRKKSGRYQSWNT